MQIYKPIISIVIINHVLVSNSPFLLEMDNIAFGGLGYYDSENINKPLLGFYNYVNKQVSWLYYYQGTTMDRVVAIKFDNDQLYFYAATKINYKLLRIEVNSGNVVQSWQVNYGQSDLIYFNTLIIDKRNQPIVGLCGWDLIQGCSYKIISYSLNPRDINWSTNSALNSNPRSFSYDSVNDLLYVAGHEMYASINDYLFIFKKNALTGQNIKLVVWKITGSQKKLDIKLLNVQGQTAVGCLALQSPGSYFGFIAYDFDSEHENIRTVTQTGSVFDCVGIYFLTDIFMLYTEFKSGVNILWYASSGIFITAGNLLSSGTKTLGFFQSNDDTISCYSFKFTDSSQTQTINLNAQSLTKYTTTSESSGLLIYYATNPITKIQVNLNQVTTSLCKTNDPFTLQLNSNLPSEYVGSGCPLLADFSYDLWDSITDLEFNHFQSQVFDKSRFRLTIQTLAIQEGIYDIKLRMLYSTGVEILPQYSFKIVITSDPCGAQTLVHSQQLPSVVLYQINKTGDMIIQYEKFIRSPVQCTEIISYSLKLEGLALLPSFIVYNSINMQLKVFSIDNKDSGIYKVDLTGTLKTTLGYQVQHTLSFQLQMVADITITSLLSNLPKNALATNFLQTQVKQTVLNQYIDSNIKEVINDSTPPNFNINPMKSEDVGNMKIRIEYTKNQLDCILQVEYSEIRVTVIDKLAPLMNYNISEVNQTQNEGQSYITKDKAIQAKIQQITKTGILQIKFSKEMNIPQNYQQTINSQVIQIQYTSNNGRGELLAGWVALDDLNLKFITNAYFQSKDGKYLLQKGVTLKTKIPRQYSNSLEMQQLQTVADIAKSTINTIVASNLALQIMTGISMQQVWDLVNIFQLIIHMDRLKLNIDTPEISVIETGFEESGYDGLNVIKNVIGILAIYLGFLAAYEDSSSLTQCI
ncbi:UNKNOWN [Stylonychia lemnae]|uniref:Uncharacterized protein n=1 Tax=Stylonychia lemnae TaxID=5949 RepID=A0A077ZW67_STYLE|nr:UNKNOWN [Stylonychia lemnae]|eukprot:CDW74114.1 UNKNOWN [Stylonychia lemnae]